MDYSSRKFNIVIYTIMILVALGSILPFVLLIISSFTDEASIVQYGYSFFPKKLSMDAYKYIYIHASKIMRAYGITVFVTVLGTATSLLVTALLAYPLSIKDMPRRKLYTFLVFFTILFNGGLVPLYLVYTQLISVKNTIFALILPILFVRGFYVLIMRAFFMGIPAALMEAAHIDGAGEFRIFFKIIMPLSLPVLATVGLFICLQYWNDWYNGMIFITDSDLYSIQNYLNRILLDITFLSKTNVSSSQAEIISRIPKGTVRMALAVIGILPIMIAYPFFQKYFVKGLTIGAVKG